MRKCDSPCHSGRLRGVRTWPRGAQTCNVACPRHCIRHTLQRKVSAAAQVYTVSFGRLVFNMSFEHASVTKGRSKRAGCNTVSDRTDVSQV